MKLLLIDNRIQYKDVLFGIAVGDALGVPVEFNSRQKFIHNPVTDMIGYGTYNFLDEITAHRVSYKLHKGEIVKKLYVCHSCSMAGVDILRGRGMSKR